METVTGSNPSAGILIIGSSPIPGILGAPNVIADLWGHVQALQG